MKEDNELFLYAKESYAILGACFEVYKAMGSGFLEQVYQECLELEFDHMKIPFSAQKKIHINYRNQNLKKFYVADFVCYNKILVEIKATQSLKNEHKSQLLNYLHATKLELGLLVNFGHYPKVQVQRLILNR